MMKGRIATDSLSRTFRLLRNRVEAEIHAPAVVLVTSATERDGAGLTAYGLAESLSHTHQRTALVTSAPPAKALPELTSPIASAPRRRAGDRLASEGSISNGMSIVTISQERLATISRSSAASLVEELRAQHDYVVVDGGDLSNNSFALLLIASADAVLVSFLSGRQQMPADRDMLDRLERAESKVLGVVMTDQETVDHFEDREPQAEVKTIAPERQPNMLAGKFENALQRIGKAF